MNRIERASRKRVEQIVQDRQQLTNFLPDSDRFWERFTRDEAQKELIERGEQV
jgi:hypothetical protein